MIEEAAGTRMYESKKQSAQRTIEKKDSKLQEIETVSKVTLNGKPTCISEIECGMSKRKSTLQSHQIGFFTGV